MDLLALLSIHWPWWTWFLLLGISATFTLCPDCCGRCTAYPSVIVTISGASTCVTGCIAYSSDQSSQASGIDPSGVTEIPLTGEDDSGTFWNLDVPNAYPFDLYNDLACEDFLASRVATLRWSVVCFKDDNPKPLGLQLIAVDFVPPVPVGVVALYSIGIPSGLDPDFRFDFGEEVALPVPCGGTLVVTPGE